MVGGLFGFVVGELFGFVVGGLFGFVVGGLFGFVVEGLFRFVVGGLFGLSSYYFSLCLFPVVLLRLRFAVFFFSLKLSYILYKPYMYNWVTMVLFPHVAKHIFFLF